MCKSKDYRQMLKSTILEELNNICTDQDKDLPQPPVQKSCPPDAKLIDLIAPENLNCGQMDLLTILKKRKSRRIFSNDPITLEELSFLLWSIQGVKKIIKKGYATLRTVPSAGARHPFETYLFIFNVKGLDSGLYRYLPLDHKLLFISSDNDFKEKLYKSCYNQKLLLESAVTFVWTAIPYRSEWRYDIASNKLIAIDAGHMCQNLYLASEAISAGTCAIAAYNQKMMDSLLNVDGKDEFTIYLAPVGKQ